MTTTRKPKKRDTRRKIGAAAIAAFRRMQAANEACTCEDGEEAELDECPACEEWWAAHRELHRALNGKPWEFPIGCRPGSAEFDATEANKMWLELEAASAEG